MRSASEEGPSTARVPVTTGRRKTVAIVVSADTNDDGVLDEEDTFHEHAVCILSYCMKYTNETVHSIPSPSQHRLLEDTSIRPHLRTRIKGAST